MSPGVDRITVPAASVSFCQDGDVLKFVCGDEAIEISSEHAKRYPFLPRSPSEDRAKACCIPYSMKEVRAWLELSLQLQKDADMLPERSDESLLQAHEVRMPCSAHVLLINFSVFSCRLWSIPAVGVPSPWEQLRQPQAAA